MKQPKPVVNLRTGMRFESINEAARWYMENHNTYGASFKLIAGCIRSKACKHMKAEDSEWAFESTLQMKED